MSRQAQGRIQDDSKVADCLGWRDGSSIDQDRPERTLGQTTSWTEPDEFGFRRVELESVVRHPLPDTTDAVDKPGCEAVHVVNEAVVVDLHVIGVSVNGEAVLISDTEYICCKKDEIEWS